MDFEYVKAWIGAMRAQLAAAGHPKSAISFTLTVAPFGANYNAHITFMDADGNISKAPVAKYSLSGECAALDWLQCEIDALPTIEALAPWFTMDQAEHRDNATERAMEG